MEVLVGYLLGLGTMVAIARRRDAARNVVAWTARQVGALSGKVATSLDEAARLAREEYARGRKEQVGQPLAEGLESPAGGNGYLVTSHAPTHLTEN
jgi:hypothetical protein